MIGAMAQRLQQYFRPSPDTRATLAALLAFCALLLPALLPYGPTPVFQAGHFVAPHPHVGISAATPHEHGGAVPQLPDAAKVLAPAILIAVLPQISLPPAPREQSDTVAPPSVAVATPEQFDPAQPRAPPAAA